MASTTDAFGAYAPKGASYSGASFYEPVVGDSLNKAVKSGYDTLTKIGDEQYAAGKQNTQAGVGGMAPVLQYLTQLTKGDQADVNQATQPQVNQIKDSFSAIRNMISQQPRGGGKAGVLAEQGSQQQKQVGDLQQGARAGAAGQLGQLSSTLAGIGLEQGAMGEKASSAADQATLTRRAQNMGPGSFASQFSSEMNAISNMASALFQPG
jgi:hypothetical protein